MAGYSGDADDAMLNPDDSGVAPNGMMFSTADDDNDLQPGGNCAQQLLGGWWYNWCSTSVINTDGTGIWKVSATYDVLASSMLVKLN